MNLASLIVLFSTCIIINIPCGYIREGHPKFSFKWLLWIHASIPVIIYLRQALEVSSWFIPFSIFFAIVGQIIGSRFRRKYMTDSFCDKLNQIPDFNLTPTDKIAENEIMVALLNMGGPKKIKNVKDFQKRLFEDPLLIRFPLSFLFQKLFAWILIKVRLKSVIKLYEMLGGGSPIYDSTTKQARAIRKELARRKRNIAITFSFNYSSPLPDDTINKVKRANKKYILPLSLYPHYSKATTGSNVHYLKQSAKNLYPDVKFLKSSPYYLHDGYIQAFVDRINETIDTNENLDDFFLVFSAHGLPLYFLAEGDPYPFQIAQTVAAILTKLNRTQNWTLSYQSAVGPLQWLKPSTEEILPALHKRGIKKMIIVPVSFVGDHIETIIEINTEYREVADHLGIEDYRMSKAIECHPGFIKALVDTIELVVENQAISENYTSKQSQNYAQTASERH